MNRNKIIRYAIILGLVAGVLLAINWYFSHSTLVIKSPDSVSGKITYEITNQANGKTDTYESEEKSFSKRVLKGDYEVIAKANGQSYFETTTTGPFLRTTVISAQYKGENKREFIGDNPESCASYQGGIAISYSCNGPMSDILAHIPASASGATHTLNGLDDVGNVENRGIVSVGGKTYVLGYGHLDLESSQEETVLYELNETAGLAGSFQLKGTDESDAYRIRPYEAGFLLYSDNLRSLLYYSSPDAEPARINTEHLDKEGFEPTAIDVGRKSVAIVYAEPQEEEKENSDDSGPRAGKTFVQIYSGGGVKTLEFDEGYTYVNLCGDSYLCYQNGEILTVYDIKGDEPKQAMKLTGVRQSTSNGGSILVEKPSGILSINPASKNGFVSYSAGEYALCGIYSGFKDGYGVCVSGEDNRLALLSVNSSLPDTDSIDKKVAGIAAQPYIENVSAYKSFIHISPNLGERIYNPATKGYEPDPAIKAQNDIQVNRLINELGINRGAYSIKLEQ